MPRAKKATKTAATANGFANNEDAVVSSTTNSGSIFSGEEAEEVVEKPAPSKPRGRAKKIITPVEEVEVPEIDEAVKKPAGRGRAKKTKADEKPAEAPESVKEPVEAPKPTKSAGRGRKKKEATTASEEVAVEPTRRSGREKKAVASIVDDEEEEDDEVVVETKKIKKPAVKRGKGKKSATPEVPEELDEAPVESPKKKAKPAAAEKKKRGSAKAKVNVAAAAAADEDEEQEEDEQEQKVVEVVEKKGSKKANAKQTKAAAAVTAVAEKKPARGRKRAAPVAVKEEVELPTDDVEDEDEADGSKPSKKAKKVAAAPLNTTGTAYNKADIDLPPLENSEEDDSLAERYNLKISSWNVAGLRAWLKKDGLKFLEYEEPDIFCMQETKCTTDQLPEEAERIAGYHPYWLCFPGGHDGVAIYSKIMPINVEYGIGNAEFDESGRLITAEYEKFFLINVYVPNSGRKLVRLEPRMRWEKLFQAYVQQLESRKPVIICGDMNVSHREIDIANPKANTRNAGFTQEERDKMSELLALGYVDTFRLLYPERKGAYTFWTYIGNARARNVGWRLDYFLVSQRLAKRVVENCMRTQCMGSDHCPITLFLKM